MSSCEYCKVFTKFLFWRALTNGLYIIIASSERLDQGRIVIWSSYISSYWSMSVDDFFKGILKTTLAEIFYTAKGLFEISEKILIKFFKTLIWYCFLKIRSILKNDFIKNIFL